MRSNYKPLGEFIREVNKRDIHIAVDMLLGVSIQKKFIPSIANIIGTDMSTYKIIKRNQFAYGPVTSRNWDKISIALLDTFDEAIVSQSYTVFEVIDTALLLPEYLMMWFRRPEFNRYARFKSHGSAREVFDWEEMCNVELPIPSIEKQKEIVAEYDILINRINLNNTLIEKLEDTAQALYKQWFVDFEFPHAEGNSYKSSGGEMIESEIGNIPKGWKLDLIENLWEIIWWATPSKDCPEYYSKNWIPWVTPKDISIQKSKFISKWEIDLSELWYRKASTHMMPAWSILFSSRAPIWYMAISKNEICTNQWFKSIVPKKEYWTAFVYYYLLSIREQIISEATGSTFDEVSTTMMKRLISIIPNSIIALKFWELCSPIFFRQEILERNNMMSINLKNLLLSRLSLAVD